MTKDGMKQRNVVNGIICSMAIIERETEKAFMLSYVAEIYGKSFTVKKQWFAKSQLDVIKIEGNTMWFVPKNDWVLDANTRKYAEYVASMFSVKQEIRNYLAFRNEKVEQVYC